MWRRRRIKPGHGYRRPRQLGRPKSPTPTNGSIRVRVSWRRTTTTVMAMTSRTWSNPRLDASHGCGDRSDRRATLRRTRDIDAGPDALEVTWDAKGNGQFLLAGRHQLRRRARTWYGAGRDRRWTERLESNGHVTSVNLGSALTQATNDGTNGTRQGGCYHARGSANGLHDVPRGLSLQGDSAVVDEVETNPWKTGPTASVTAKTP